eukprot:scaffold98_cov307-Prasinococcus_capsulatus_cf.AAC.12
MLVRRHLRANAACVEETTSTETPVRWPDVVIAGIQIDIAFPVASDLTVVLGEVLVEAGYELEFSDEAIVAIGTGDNLGRRARA